MKVRELGRRAATAQAGGAISTDPARRWAPVLAGALTAVLLAATLEIVLDGATGHSPLIPKSPRIAGWMGGIGEHLGYRVFLIALLAYAGAYGAHPAARAAHRARAGRSR